MQETVSRISISQPSSTAAATAASNDDKEIELLIAPRCHLVSAQARSQLNSRRVTPTCGGHAAVAEEEKKGCGGGGEVVGVSEKELANGDIYTGTLSGGVPHGKGKYLWSDGCMYEGEWKRGKAYGKGKFSWPSGATYEGDFKSGRMDGQGTFIGVDGESYKGRWVGDRKHGFGEKRYANGDVYRGGWRSNLQDGEGKYLWSNGNEYCGGWRNGVIHGKGVLIWANGNRYHGVWENGMPKGRGVFAPGPSCCSGGADSSNVNANNSDNGSNCNSCSSSGRDRIMKEDCFVPRKRLSVDTNLPKICIWELDGEAGDITCDIVDNVGASLFCKDVWVCNDDCGAESVQSQKSPSCGSSADGDSAGGEVKKPGQMISKGHKNYDLMCNLQLGIRYSVGKHASIMRELRQSDFDPNEKFWTRFPPEGSKNTPPHQSGDFRWKDYCPMVFRHLRELFAIDAVDYMLAICGSDALREFSSPGKSGSFFYLTQDERFMIKTVKKSEVKVFTRMLPSYYQHVCQYNNSLITKFLGLHCVKPAGGPKMRFIVMGNLFSSQYRIHKRFDLKGSSYGRTTVKAEGEIDETTTLKDLDLNFVFRLERSWYQELIRQINRDCEFLEAEGIMDYSLLIGLHFCDGNFSDEMKMSPTYMHLDDRKVHLDETSMRGYHLLPNMDWVMEGRGSLIHLGANMSARAECVSKTELDQFMGGGCSKSSRSQRGGEVFDVVLCLGIIDILQDYDISKKLEHAYKSLQVDPTSISAVDPKLYSKRFRDFIHRIFVEDK